MLRDVPRGASRPTRRAGRSTRRACCSPARSASSRRSGSIKTLERSGCYIVDDDFVQVHRWIQRRHRRPTAIRWTAWCTAFLDDAIAQPDALHRRRRRRARSWSSASRESGAEGVLFCAPSASATRRCSTSRWRSRAVETRRHPVDRVQVRREHRPVPGHPRAGRHVRRLDQAVERGMTTAAAARRRPQKDASQVRQKEMIARHFDAARARRRRPARRASTRSCPATSPSCC